MANYQQLNSNSQTVRDMSAELKLAVLRDVLSSRCTGDCLQDMDRRAENLDFEDRVDFLLRAFIINMRAKRLSKAFVQRMMNQVHTALVHSTGDYPVENAIAMWLHAKTNRSNSAKTRRAYEDTLDSFRALLRRAGLDLDSPSREVTTLAQGWAALPKANGAPVTASTHNQRLAIVSSFYTFVRKRQLLHLDNPIEAIERMPVQSYASAHALSSIEVQRYIQAIDRDTPNGKRDYALIALALQTGRRLAELANMRVGSLHTEGEHITITFRAKGGKIMRDTLPSSVTKALIEYLGIVYPGGLSGLEPEAPIWIDLHVRNRGTALTPRAISDIWRKRLGTGKVHSSRHTFAVNMERVGAKVSDIQGRLGHSNLATTGRYLASLKSAENEHGDQLAALFGFN